MNLRKLVLTIALITPFLVNAQTQPNNNEIKCGINQQTAELIKQRLMDNRDIMTKLGIQNVQNGRTITYIPVSIHNVANDASGLGKTSESAILGFLCGLNALYADQDVQFFIHNVIYNRVSNAIYTNAGTTTARNHMMSYRVTNTLNLIIGTSLSNPVASWYDGFGDFVFLLQQMLSSEAITEGHEIGHFFTLPHTFYGWENKDVEALYGGGNVIGNLGWGQQSENAPRTGTQANCSTAADGFCDTEADYYSDRKNCPYVPTVFDRFGNTINPDESNIMSYSYDACITGFSAEQKAAIAIDIAQRNWVTNTPASTADVTGLAAVVSPLQNAQLGSITDPTVLLDWTDVPGATWYYLEVFGTQFPGLWLPNANDVIYRGIIYNSNSQFNLPTTNLVANSRYAWRVKALNSLSTCAGISSYATFQAVTSVTTSIKDLPIEKQMTLAVLNNPISGTDIPLTIYAAEEVVGSIRVYSMDGREVLSFTKQVFNQGESLIQLPAEQLSNGMYVAVLSTDRGLLQQKLIIQR